MDTDDHTGLCILNCDDLVCIVKICVQDGSQLISTLSHDVCAQFCKECAKTRRPYEHDLFRIQYKFTELAELLADLLLSVYYAYNITI